MLMLLATHFLPIKKNWLLFFEFATLTIANFDKFLLRVIKRGGGRGLFCLFAQDIYDSLVNYGSRLALYKSANEELNPLNK